MITRLLFVIAIILLTSAQLTAQQYTYLYDAAGNRIKVTILKSSTAAEAEDDNQPVEVSDKGKVFKLYPNPTKGLVTIECPGITVDTKVSCVIYDASGRFVSNAVFKGLQTFECDLSAKPTGLYIFQVKFQDEVHVLKVLKE